MKGHGIRKRIPDKKRVHYPLFDGKFSTHPLVKEHRTIASLVRQMNLIVQILLR